MAESAEGARLLSECTPKSVPRVRIPLSPPLFTSHNSQPKILIKPERHAAHAPRNKLVFYFSSC